MAKQLAFSITKKDFKFDYFCAGGPGGHKQNKTASACRITHVESGISAESRVYRTQLENKTEAFRKLANSPKFRAWINLKLYNLIHTDPEIVVEKMMSGDNLLVECRDANGVWITMPDDLGT